MPQRAAGHQYQPRPGTLPHSRWRAGDRDDEALQGHNVDTRTWRQVCTERRFPAELRRVLLTTIEETGTLARAAAELGVSQAQVWGIARWHDEFADELEGVLSGLCARDRPRTCGSEAGYKASGRCAACRAAHHRPAAEGPRSARRGHQPSTVNHRDLHRRIARKALADVRVARRAGGAQLVDAAALRAAAEDIGAASTLWMPSAITAVTALADRYDESDLISPTL